MKLIITCQRNLEKQTIDEVSTFLDEFGDPNSKVSKTKFSGIIQAYTSLDTIEVITKIRKKISEEPLKLTNEIKSIKSKNSELPKDTEDIIAQAEEYLKK